MLWSQAVPCDPAGSTYCRQVDHFSSTTESFNPLSEKHSMSLAVHSRSCMHAHSQPSTLISLDCSPAAGKLPAWNHKYYQLLGE
jgi:hypothetical protein